MRAVALALLVALAGCGASSSAVVLGPGQPPKPGDCPMRLVALPPEELFDDYLRVGSICLAPAPVSLGVAEDLREAVKHPGGERDELFGRACALGGDVIALAGRCGRGRSTFEFAVLRARQTEE
jgi:hypothetical protein